VLYHLFDSDVVVKATVLHLLSPFVLLLEAESLFHSIRISLYPYVGTFKYLRLRVSDLVF